MPNCEVRSLYIDFKQPARPEKFQLSGFADHVESQ